MHTVCSGAAAGMLSPMGKGRPVASNGRCRDRRAWRSDGRPAARAADDAISSRSQTNAGARLARLASRHPRLIASMSNDATVAPKRCST